MGFCGVSAFKAGVSAFKAGVSALMAGVSGFGTGVLLVGFTVVKVDGLKGDLVPGGPRWVAGEGTEREAGEEKVGCGKDVGVEAVGGGLEG